MGYWRFFGTSMVKDLILIRLLGHVKYLGHWAEELNLITEKLSKVNKKPDLILILKDAERSWFDGINIWRQHN